MQIRFVTVVIFLHTLQLINDLVDYRIFLFVIWIKNRLQTGKNIVFGLLSVILNELVWELLFGAQRATKRKYAICPLLYRHS